MWVLKVAVFVVGYDSVWAAVCFSLSRPRTRARVHVWVGYVCVRVCMRVCHARVSYVGACVCLVRCVCVHVCRRLARVRASSLSR